MAQRTQLKTTFEPGHVIEPTYTGGGIALSQDGQVLATCIGEDALLTDLQTGQQLARIEGDGEAITSLALTSSATHLILSSRSLALRIFSLDRASFQNVVSCTLLRTLKPHSTPVVSSAVDLTGTLLATGGADGVVKIWDIAGGYATHTFHGHGGVISALHFFKVDVSRQANGIDEKYGKKPKKIKSQTIEEDSDDGIATFRLASGDEEGKIRIWHLQKRKCIAILDSHVSVIRGLDFNEKEQLLLSGSRDKTAMLWDASTWKVRTTIPVLESIEATGFISEREGLFFTGGESGRVRLWWLTGQEATEPQKARHEGQSISDIIYNSVLSCLMTIHADQNLQLHSLKAIPNRQGTTCPPLDIFRRISGTHDEVIDLAYAGGNDRLLAVATNLEEIKLISLASSTAEDTHGTRPQYFGADVGLLQGHDDIVICLDVDWSGHWLATGAKDNTARLWRIDSETNSFTCHSSFSGHAESVGAVSLTKQQPPINTPAYTSPLNNPPSFLITGSQDRTIKRWDIGNVSFPSTLHKITRATYTRKAHDKDINAISISPDSHLFASASQDRTVKIWSLDDGEPIGVLRGHKRGVWSVAFAPAGTPAISGEQAGNAQRGLIITGSGDKTVKLWNLRDYSCLRTFEGHTNSVLKVIWLPPAPIVEPKADEDDIMFDDEEDDAPTAKPDATPPKITPPQIASAGSDGLVKIWDASTGEVECTLDNHTDRIWALAVTTTDSSPRTLVSGAADAFITFWNDTTSQTYLAASALSTARVEQDQDLANYMRAGAYREAITLALALDHPGRLLSLFTSVVNKYPPEDCSLSGVSDVDEVLGSLDDTQLLALLGRLRDWNTNAKTAMVSQRILWTLLRLYPASKFTGLKGRVPGAKGAGGVKEVLDALRVYTERHLRRWEELMDESWLVEYTLGQMDDVSGGAKSDIVIVE